MPLTSFTLLSQEWSGEHIMLPFGEDEETITREVVGWTDLFMGQSCSVHVVKAQTRDENQTEGYLVYGGNSGLRILDDDAEAIPGVDEHLPTGYGYPIVWVEELADLPAEVQAVVSQSLDS